MFSCVQDGVEEPVNPGIGKKPLKVYIEQPGDAQTRLHLTSDYKVEWDDGDEFAYADLTTQFDRYRYSADEGMAFWTDISNKPDNALDYAYGLYPYSSAVEFYASGDANVKVRVSNEQTYVPGSFDPAANIMMACHAEGTNAYFRNVFGLLGIKLYGEGVKVNKISLIAPAGETLFETFYLSMEPGGIPAIVSKEGPNYLDLICQTPVALSSSESDYTEFFFVVPPGDYTRLAIVVEGDDGGEFQLMTSHKVTIERAHVHHMAPVEVVLEGGSPAIPEYVDLGLSVPWATFNVGARAPEEFGNLYMWAETEPRTTGFGMGNWKYYDGTSAAKYCLWPEDGTVDHRIALDPADDVATVTYGSEWRMPSLEELLEFKENCSFSDASQNGVKGTLVTGPNGNTIFLPAVGFGGHISPEAYSYLRSSSAYVTIMPNVGLYAYCFGYYGNVSTYGAYTAFNGFSVRAVHAPLVNVSGVSISEEPFDLLVNATKTLTVTVQPSNATHKRVTWTSSNPSVASVSWDGVVTGLSAGGSVIRAWSEDGKKTTSVRVTVKDYEVPEAVDMGVSVKWAKVNLGAPANEVQHPGGYYAWGELNPKESYTWDDYLWGSSADELTKYFSGDGQKQLDILEDDAARHYLGGVWRVPTKEEWTELLNACNIETYSASSSSSTTLPGIKLTSKKNGNSIYLPAAGYRDDGLRQLRKYAYYLSASLEASSYGSFSGPGIRLSNPGAVIISHIRSRGYPIRPVLPDKISVTGFYIQTPPATLHVGETQQLCGVVEPENASLPGITWSSSDESVATVDEKGVVSAVSNGTAVITGTTDDGGFSDSFTLTVTYKVPELVDMGLPSGVKWAKYNLGAVSMQDTGVYFAWGETAPKDEYTTTTHTYYNGSSLSLFTQEEGFLDSEHDAATVHLGDGWRIPTMDDFDELVQNCSFLSGSYGSTAGFWAINNDDTQKRIFFPKTGRMNGTNLSNTIYSLGWLSDYASGAVFGFGIAGDEDGVSPALYQFSWYVGLPIRAVHD